MISRLALKEMSVSYGTNVVLTRASVEFLGGRMHALLGPNGSGKSSLIKGLAGLASVHPGVEYEGPGGQMRQRLGTRERRDWGMAFIHQDLGLIPQLSITDNFFIGGRQFPRRRRVGVDWKAAHSQCRAALEEVGLSLDPRLPLSDFGRKEQIQVAVGRALMYLPPTGGFLFVDEVTAYLDGNEAAQLLSRLRDLAEQRKTGIVFVSHRLEEVSDFANWVTVIRDGHIVVDASADDLSSGTIRVALGAGAQTTLPTRSVGDGRQADGPGATPVFELRGANGPVLRDLDLQVRAGEILGVVGLEGEGKEDLADLLSGSRGTGGGTAILAGEVVGLSARGDLVRRGMGFVPADRLRTGGIPGLSVLDNLLLASYSDHAPYGWFRSRRALVWCREQLRRFAVAPADPRTSFGSLSGGNQQKVILARWLSLDCKFLVLHEPTAGVDVGARERIYAELVGAASQGLAVLIITSDLIEAETICDRVLVLLGGQIKDELHGEDVTAARLVDSSFGLSELEEVSPNASTNA